MSGGCASHSWQTEAPGDFGPGLFLCCDAAHQQLRAAFHKGPQVAGLFVAEERGSHELKGAPKPVTLFRLVRASGGGRHVSNGSLQEGDSTLFALIGQHLHERDPRGIVDANMNELPPDAVVTVDGAGISSGDAVPDGADAAELFDTRWMRSPACSRSWRRIGSAGSKALSLFKPSRRIR